MSKSPKVITIYNHKGGVGKTTLTINIAQALIEQGNSVLLVDTDPQCNLTSYLLSDDVVDKLLDTSDAKNGRTIWTALSPVFNGEGDIKPIKPTQIEEISLLPGDIRLSEYEEFLGEAWTDSFKRRSNGLKAVSSISRLVRKLDSVYDYDYVFYDTGPNIGALNRVLLLDSDYFIVPVACDLFSVRALSTLGQTLKNWIIDYKTISDLAPNDAYLLKGKPKFLGYLPQRFKEYGQTMAHEPANYLRQIKKHIFSNVSSVLRKVDKSLAPPPSNDPVIGKVRDFSALVQVAQREGVSLWDCSNPNNKAKKDAEKAFDKIADYIEDKS